MTNQEKLEKGLGISQTDALTGETTFIPYTDEEITLIEVPVVETPIDPLEKLKQFLSANPDVAEIIKG